MYICNDNDPFYTLLYQIYIPTPFKQKINKEQKLLKRPQPPPLLPNSIPFVLIIIITIS